MSRKAFNKYNTKLEKTVGLPDVHRLEAKGAAGGGLVRVAVMRMRGRGAASWQRSGDSLTRCRRPRDHNL